MHGSLEDHFVVKGSRGYIKLLFIIIILFIIKSYNSYFG